MAKLTAKSVERAKPGRHGDGRGLYLLVSQSGAKSWVLRVQSRGRRRDIGLGSLAERSLAEAREKAAELRKVAKSGRDPIAARDKERVEAPTFEKAARACHEAKGRGWADKTADGFISSLQQHAFPKLGNLSVDSVDERDVLAALNPIWHDKPSAARKLQQRINMVLDYAKGHGWRSAGALRDGLRPLLSKQRKAGNFAAMPYGDVPEFVSELRSKRASSGRLALLFTILTAARSGEVRSARWLHVDLEARTWTRPANLMKSREEHIVTLSPAAIEVLKQAEALRTTSADSAIFPGTGGRSLSDMTLLKIVKAHGSYSVHGFRSSFRTWAAEQMPTIPDAVAEAALAHTVPDAVVRAYQRAKFIELRQQLLDAWADYIEGRSRVLRLAS